MTSGVDFRYNGLYATDPTVDAIRHQQAGGLEEHADRGGDESRRAHGHPDNRGADLDADPLHRRRWRLPGLFCDDGGRALHVVGDQRRTSRRQGGQVTGLSSGVAVLLRRPHGGPMRMPATQTKWSAIASAEVLKAKTATSATPTITTGIAVARRCGRHRLQRRALAASSGPAPSGNWQVYRRRVAGQALR